VKALVSTKVVVLHTRRRRRRRRIKLCAKKRSCR
jgi:hypothetical protein